jgi:sugar/nucleoside kinase (ribokinase family)
LTGIDETVVSIEQAVDWTKIEMMGVRLLEFGVRKFVVVHTPAGAVCVDREKNVFRQGSVLVDRSEIKSTSGAGDAFAAGMLYGLMTNLSLPESLEMAVANAAWNIQQVGTSVGMAGAAEVLLNARHRGFRAII